MLGSEFFLGLNFSNQKYNEGITKWFPLTNDDVNVIFPKQFPSNGDSQAFANGDALNNVFWVIKAGWGWEDNYLENYRVIDQLFSNDPSSGGASPTPCAQTFNLVISWIWTVVYFSIGVQTNVPWISLSICMREVKWFKLSGYQKRSSDFFPKNVH